MANPHKGEVAFDAGGQRHVLKFSIDAICSLEAETGRGLFALIKDLQDESKITVILARQLLWAGLLEHQPGITVKEAGDLILAAGGVLSVVGLIGDALAVTFPESKEKKGARPRKPGSPRNGIGPDSTASGAGSGGTTNPSGERPHAKSV